MRLPFGVGKRIYLIALLWTGLLGWSFQAEAAEPPFWGFSLDGYPVTVSRLKDIEIQTGLPAQVVVFFLQWPAPGLMGDFPAESLEAIWSQGAVPCITWEPMYQLEGREIAVPAEEILRGRYDAYLHVFAEGARRWGRPLLIRFAHEMNLERYHWGTDRKDYGPGSPDLYRRMFRYVTDFFRRDKAENVRWVFCPNAESVPDVSYDPAATWNTIEAYYPGNDAVDILGMDGYNWGAAKTKEKDGWKSRWQSFREIFAPLHGRLRRLAPEKPILVFETASVNAGGDRAAWIREALQAVSEWELRGICWFQEEKETDWCIDGKRDAEAVGFIRRETSTVQRWFGEWRP